MTRPTLRHLPILSAMIALAGLWLVGCSAGSPESMAIEVRDAASHEPVPDAVVRIQVLNLFLPIPPYETLNSSPPPATAAQTDADGRAIIQSRRGAPVEIFIAAPGYPPLELTLGAHPLDEPSDEWRRDPDATGQIPTPGDFLEVRLRPADGGRNGS